PRVRGRASPIAVGSGRAARPRGRRGEGGEGGGGGEGGEGGEGASAPLATEAPFAGVATEAEWMGAVVVDEQGAVAVGGIAANGADVGAALANHLAGAPEEANGAASYLGLGAWRTLTVESERAHLLVEPVGATGRLLIVAAHPETPPGRTLRIREAVRGEAARRLARGGSAGSEGSADGE
ncbi:MAG: roadblock/LC7 domain-containing protein, partial [Gemmatimonadota bacterium]